MERSKNMETETSPLLSVVIATRNRIVYAISAIESILEIPDIRLELIIQDNSDARDLERYVHESIKDSRLRYRYTPPPLSSIGNFNAAVEMATGEYVCLIGDDDGVNPEIIEAAVWAKSNNVDCLAVRTPAIYLWQGAGVSSTLFTKVKDGSLSVSDFRGFIRDGNLESEMRKFVRNGGASYLDLDLPKLYHGLVHRRCLKRIHDKTGVYLGGLSPDIFASLSIACVANRVAVTDYPLTIPGICGVSSSAVEGSIRRHSRRLEDAPHFRSRGEYHWCELVPCVYSVETLWADSGVAALRAMGRADLVLQLNRPKLAAYCIVANRGVVLPVLRDLFKSMRDLRENRAWGVIRFVWCLGTGPGQKLALRVWNRFLIIVGMRSGHHRIDGLTSMAEVTNALVGYLKSRGRSFMDGVCSSAN
jgi:hypothetical protein